MVSQTSDPPKTGFQTGGRSPVRYVLLAAVLLFLLWFGLKAWRIGQATQSLLAMQTEAQAMLDGGLTNIDPDQAETMVLDARRHLLTIKRETAVFMSLTPYLGWLPKIGPLVTAAEPLLEMADAGAETAVYAVRGLKPGLAVLQADAADESRIPQLVQVLADAQPDLAQASRAFAGVLKARARIDNLADFPGRAQALFAQADEWLPRAEDGLQAAQILPALLGHDGRRQYLLVAQNEDELRPTGGFFSGVGLLVVENGRILDLSFQDASVIDDLANNSPAYDYPPRPLLDFMGADYFLFRDTNYWPDFPTSAQNGIELYRLGQGIEQIDGVIAIDQQFLALLVEATGPITGAETNSVINADNIIDSFRDSFNREEGQTVREWFNNRKAFLTTISSAIRTRLETDFSAVDPIILVRNLFTAVEEKHLQIYLTDPETAVVLADLGWDGRLKNPTGQDFLLVVDTSMGFNKANIFVERQLDYSVRLHEDGSGTAHLNVRYTHSGSASEPCIQGVPYADAPEYLEIADKCYFNYLRVYTPAGTQLMDSSRHTVPGAILVRGADWNSTAATTTEIDGFTTFANFLMVPRGEQVTGSLTYSLPPTAVQQQTNQSVYRLTLAKQAGTDADPVTVTVTLPENTHLVGALPTPQTIQDNQVTFRLTLHRDQQIQLVYGPAESD